MRSPGRPIAVILAGVVAGIAGPIIPSMADAAEPAGDPAYSVDLATLDAALDCDPFEHPDREPVLLVHGTFTAGHEQWDWNYAILLRQTGHDVCVVTYPNRGLDDMQISAEYVARAVQRIHAESGRKVDMVGHSQGALMPRWAIKWWPSVQAALDDFVLLAGPNHGQVFASQGSFPTGQPAVFFQFSATSRFITALNDGDETPGDVDYTSIYTATDELIQPVEPPTAALDLGTSDPAVANILTQDVCPLRVVDHLSIGTTDAFVHALTLDALDNPGPTDLSRVAPDAVLCNVPDQFVVPDTFPNLVAQFERSREAGFPDFTPVTEEPPLRSYATTSDTGSASPAPVDPRTAPDQPAMGDTDRAGASGSGLPATGRAIPLLAAGIAIGIALLLRIGRSKP